jgi:hypothetical protein
MQNSTLATGDKIEGRCTKCRKNNEHLIITLQEESPGQVECTVCHRQHKFRPPTAAKKPSTRKANQPNDAERKEWKTLRPGMNTAKATEYSMTDAYRNKALINHAVFGLGLVQRVVGSQKIEVLFEEGKKTMRCK